MIYVAGGGIAGLTSGLLLPLAVRPIGAAAVGFVSMLLPMAGCLFAIPGFSETPVGEQLKMILLATAAAGPALALAVRSEFMRKESKGG